MGAGSTGFDAEVMQNCLQYYRSLISSDHLGKPGGLGSSAPCVLGHPTAVPFLHPGWVLGTNTALQLRVKTILI